jgi:hypothetical protein
MIGVSCDVGNLILYGYTGTVALTYKSVVKEFTDRIHYFYVALHY